MLRDAIKKYKDTNKITLVDRNTRDLIQNKLRQKIVINYLARTDFLGIENRKIYASIKYCRGFIKTQSRIEAKQIWTAIQDAKTVNLKNLPKKPQEINKETLDMLPFSLLVQNRTETRVVVNILRLIFQFE